MVVVFDVAERAVPAAPAISATSASSGAILVVRIVLLPLSGGRFSAASAATAGHKACGFRRPPPADRAAKAVGRRAPRNLLAGQVSLLPQPISPHPTDRPRRARRSGGRTRSSGTSPRTTPKDAANPECPRR